MPDTALYWIISAVVALVLALIGFFAGSVYRRKSAEATLGSAEDEAKRILSDAMKNAESRKKEALVEAKDEIYRLRQDAEKKVRVRLVLEAVAEAEQFEISDEEIDAELKAIADQYSMQIEQVRNLISHDAVSYDLRQRKALELIKETAGK